jgi:hypothetical protein
MTSHKILNLEDGADYDLPPGARCVWIGVKDFAVYIVSTDEGVVVDIFANGCEMEEPLASAYAFDQEAKEVISERIKRDAAE